MKVYTRLITMMFKIPNDLVLYRSFSKTFSGHCYERQYGIYSVVFPSLLAASVNLSLAFPNYLMNFNVQGKKKHLALRS